MKNLSYILHGVSLVAILALFVLVLRKPGTSGSGQKAALSDSTAKNTGGLYFVDYDTLTTYYTYYKDTKTALETQERAAAQRISAREQGLQQEFVEFQKAVQRLQNSAPSAAAQAEDARLQKKQAELQRKQQELEAYSQQQQRAVAEASEAKTLELQKQVRDYVRELNADGNFNIVFSHGTGSPMLYVNPSMDITRQVVDGLNAKYISTTGKK